MVFYDRASLLDAWGENLEVLGAFDNAFDSQSAVVLRKPDATSG